VVTATEVVATARAAAVLEACLTVTPPLSVEASRAAPGDTAAAAAAVVRLGLVEFAAAEVARLGVVEEVAVDTMASAWRAATVLAEGVRRARWAAGTARPQSAPSAHQALRRWRR